MVNCIAYSRFVSRRSSMILFSFLSCLIVTLLVMVEITEGFLFPTASTRLMPTMKTQRLWKLQRDDDIHNPRSDIPSRYDTCIVVADGVIGMETKEMYLKNGHYVVNFPMAFVGHFTAAHDWERLKPTETMWISCEVWDDMATKNKDLFRRGSHFKSVGNLISNKWVDKSTGEERKQFRYRISKILTDSEFYEVTKLLDLDSSEESSLDTRSGSGSSWQPTSRQQPQNAVGGDFASPHTDSTNSRRTQFGNKSSSFPVGSSDSSTPEPNHSQANKQTFWTPSQRRDNSEPTDYWR